jgi:hypothetical protein
MIDNSQQTGWRARRDAGQKTRTPASVAQGAERPPALGSQCELPRTRRGRERCNGDRIADIEIRIIGALTGADVIL